VIVNLEVLRLSPEFWLQVKAGVHLSEGGERQLEEEVEAVDDAHAAGLNRGQVLKHEVPHLKKIQIHLKLKAWFCNAKTYVTFLKNFDSYNIK
jgi:hypothetical protein